jgi:tRNA (guanine-N7-)-methyltransferase
MMSRRTLRKPNPNLDLSRSLLAWTDLPRPWDAAALFGRTAPLEVEVGSGKGLFLSAAATTQPDTDFFGIEIAPKYAEFAAARLARRDVANARLLNADAERFFSDVLPDDSLAAVHVYFPDPWWKARHRKRRVMNEKFLKNVERTLRPGGTLHFWTDVEEYFQTSLAVIATATSLDGPHPVPERLAEHDLDYRTHFERRMRMHGESVYRATFWKAAASGSL